jgi:imidazole glycerol phosphate synthase subunit HisF
MIANAIGKVFKKDPTAADLELAKKIISNTDLPIIFEGGLGNIEQIIDMIKIGANSFAIGSMITFKDYNIFKIKQHLFNKGYKVRF